MPTRFIWPSDTDAMVALYDDELNVVLDRLLPTSQFVGRQRPTDPWFDKECRDAKRRLERAPAAAVAAHDDYSHAPPLLLPCSTLLPPRRRERINGVCIISCGSRRAVNSGVARSRQIDQSDPRKLWKTVDILGRGRLPPSSAIDVSSFNRFFAEKVAKVLSTTIQCTITNVQLPAVWRILLQLQIGDS